MLLSVSLALTSCPHQVQNRGQLAAPLPSSSGTLDSEQGSALDGADNVNAAALLATGTPLLSQVPPLASAASASDGTVPVRQDDADLIERDVDSGEASSARRDSAPGETPERLAAERQAAAGDDLLSEMPRVYSIGRETWIFSEPRFDAKKLGYLRFGAAVQRAPEAVSRRGCKSGWYGIKPSGFVCANGRTATIDAQHPLVLARVEQPDRMATLPFTYAIARRGIPRFFGYAPSGSELPVRAFSKRMLSQLDAPRTMTLPDWLRQPRQVYGYKRAADRAALGDGLAGGGVALLGFYTDAGSLYGFTPDLELVTTDGLEPVRASAFAGRSLALGEELPIGFAMNDATWLYRGEPRDGALRPVRRVTRREAFALTGNRIQLDGQEWLSTRDGNWLPASGVRVIASRTDWPEWARDDQVWVDVSINQHTLVAYEGRRAAYATLVSTGIDGLMDPATSKSTKTGVFHVVSKHLTATMNGDEPDEAYEMREVPWVQYFSEGYALHGAYWHDAFGQPRSHGCVNLSPIDARWLFHFTHPGLPRGWHGTIPLEQSATVYVHP